MNDLPKHRHQPETFQARRPQHFWSPTNRSFRSSLRHSPVELISIVLLHLPLLWLSICWFAFSIFAGLCRPAFYFIWWAFCTLTACALHSFTRSSSRLYLRNALRPRHRLPSLARSLPNCSSRTRSSWVNHVLSRYWSTLDQRVRHQWPRFATPNHTFTLTDIHLGDQPPIIERLHVYDTFSSAFPVGDHGEPCLLELTLFYHTANLSESDFDTSDSSSTSQRTAAPTTRACHPNRAPLFNLNWNTRLFGSVCLGSITQIALRAHVRLLLQPRSSENVHNQETVPLAHCFDLFDQCTLSLVEPVDFLHTRATRLLRLLNFVSILKPLLVDIFSLYLQFPRSQTLKWPGSTGPANILPDPVAVATVDQEEIVNQVVEDDDDKLVDHVNEPMETGVPIAEITPTSSTTDMNVIQDSKSFQPASDIGAVICVDVLELDDLNTNRFVNWRNIGRPLTSAITLVPAAAYEPIPPAGRRAVFCQAQLRNSIFRSRYFEFGSACNIPIEFRSCFPLLTSNQAVIQSVRQYNKHLQRIDQQKQRNDQQPLQTQTINPSTTLPMQDKHALTRATSMSNTTNVLPTTAAQTAIPGKLDSNEDSLIDLFQQEFKDHLIGLQLFVYQSNSRVRILGELHLPWIHLLGDFDRNGQALWYSFGQSGDVRALVRISCLTCTPLRSLWRQAKRLARLALPIGILHVRIQDGHFRKRINLHSTKSNGILTTFDQTPIPADPLCTGNYSFQVVTQLGNLQRSTPISEYVHCPRWNTDLWLPVHSIDCQSLQVYLFVVFGENRSKSILIDSAKLDLYSAFLVESNAIRLTLPNVCGWILLRVRFNAFVCPPFMYRNHTRHAKQAEEQLLSTKSKLSGGTGFAVNNAAAATPDITSASESLQRRLAKSPSISDQFEPGILIHLAFSWSHTRHLQITIVQLARLRPLIGQVAHVYAVVHLRLRDRVVRVFRSRSLAIRSETLTIRQTLDVSGLRFEPSEYHLRLSVHETRAENMEHTKLAERYSRLPALVLGSYPLQAVFVLPLTAIGERRLMTASPELEKKSPENSVTFSRNYDASGYLNPLERQQSTTSITSTVANIGVSASGANIKSASN